MGAKSLRERSALGNRAIGISTGSKGYHVNNVEDYHQEQSTPAEAVSTAPAEAVASVIEKNITPAEAVAPIIKENTATAEAPAIEENTATMEAAAPAAVENFDFADVVDPVSDTKSLTSAENEGEPDMADSSDEAEPAKTSVEDEKITKRQRRNQEQDDDEKSRRTVYLKASTEMRLSKFMTEQRFNRKRKYSNASAVVEAALDKFLPQ